MRTLIIILSLISSACISYERTCLTTAAHYLKLLPKAELHIHLGGAYPLPFLLSIATPEQAERLTLTLDLIQRKTTYQDIFSCFQIVGQIVNTEEKVTRGVEALCQELQADAVTYAEIRTGLKNLNGGYEAYLQAVLRGIQAQSSPNFQATVLLSLQRNSTLEMAKTTVDLALKYRDLGVVGIDLSGDSSLGESTRILPELIRAKQEGLSLMIHMGESPKETDQLSLLQALHPDRIGHGVHLSREAKEWIVHYQIPIEVCLTSSILVEFIEHYADHPAIHSFAQGHPIVFCTDDPLLFSTFLTQELLIAHTQAGLSLEEITHIVQDSFRYTAKRI